MLLMLVNASHQKFIKKYQPFVVMGAAVIACYDQPYLNIGPSYLIGKTAPAVKNLSDLENDKDTKNLKLIWSVRFRG